MRSPCFGDFRTCQELDLTSRVILWSYPCFEEAVGPPTLVTLILFCGFICIIVCTNMHLTVISYIAFCKLLGLWKCALFLHASIPDSYSQHSCLWIVMSFRGTSPLARSQALQLLHPCTTRTVLTTCFSRAGANHFLEQSRGIDESKDLWNAIKHK